MIDIGAGIGEFCVAAAQAVGAGGRVVAIESDPLLAEACRTNLERHAPSVPHHVVNTMGPPSTRSPDACTSAFEQSSLDHYDVVRIRVDAAFDEPDAIAGELLRNRNESPRVVLLGSADRDDDQSVDEQFLRRVFGGTGIVRAINADGTEGQAEQPCRWWAWRVHDDPSSLCSEP